MSLLPTELREDVRTRAEHACEFCGVTETDTGGTLTVDHFRPRAAGGQDDPRNLVYCCIHCNQYKADYWPSNPDDPTLWNPRSDDRDRHFLLDDCGSLRPLTPTGAFTIDRLRLNRAPLIAHRVEKQRRGETERLLRRYRGALALLEDMRDEYAGLLEEHRLLLEEQRRLLDAQHR